jgi:hypothetical protein
LFLSRANFGPWICGRSDIHITPRRTLPADRLMGRSRGRMSPKNPNFPRRGDPSVLSPKYEVFCRRSVGCFSRRSEPDWRRSAHIFVIRVERATRKNSPLAPAQGVAMKMGRRLRCSSVTYRFRYAPPRALPAAHFDRNKIPRISGTGH